MRDVTSAKETYSADRRHRPVEQHDCDAFVGAFHMEAGARPLHSYSLTATGSRGRYCRPKQRALHSCLHHLSWQMVRQLAHRVGERGERARHQTSRRWRRRHVPPNIVLVRRPHKACNLWSSKRHTRSEGWRQSYRKDASASARTSDAQEDGLRQSATAKASEALRPTTQKQ